MSTPSDAARTDAASADAAGGAAVRVIDLHHTLPDGRRLFEGLDLTIDRGESLALLGPSGGGKSTLLRMVAGLAQVDSGTIDLSGLRGGGDRGRHDLAVVFQQPHLFPWLNVRENVALGSRFAATRDRVRTDHIDELLERFGIAELAGARVDALSGGQAQRVSVIRAAATNPSLMLLDEPFSALDPLTRGELQRWLVDVTDELAVTTLLVTHDVDEALVVGSDIALLGGGGTGAGDTASSITQRWGNPFRGGGTADGDESAVDFRAEILRAYSSADRR